MNEMPPADWSDLAKLWQADGAAVSIDDIERHMRRERAQMLGVLIAEIGGLAVGTGAAVWLFFSRGSRGWGWSPPCSVVSRLCLPCACAGSANLREQPICCNR
jgi:predicted sugar kinase